jgi:hypothetical protein
MFEIQFNPQIVFIFFVICPNHHSNPDGATSDGLRAGKPGIDNRQRQGIIHFPTTVGTVTSLRTERYGVRIPVRRSQFSVLKNFQTSPLSHTASYSMGTGVPSRQQIYRGVILTTHLRLAPRLRISGAIRPFHRVRLHGVERDSCTYYCIQTECGVHYSSFLHVLEAPSPSVK